MTLVATLVVAACLGKDDRPRDSLGATRAKAEGLTW